MLQLRNNLDTGTEVAWWKLIWIQGNRRCYDGEVLIEEQLVKRIGWDVKARPGMIAKTVKSMLYCASTGAFEGVILG